MISNEISLIWFCLTLNTPQQMNHDHQIRSMQCIIWKVRLIHQPFCIQVKCVAIDLCVFCLKISTHPSDLNDRSIHE